MIEVAYAEPPKRLGLVVGRRARRLAMLLVLVIAIAIAGLGVSGGPWLGHPTVFRPYGDGEGGPAAVGQTLFLDAGVYPAAAVDNAGLASAAVTVGRLTPRIVENTSNAEIDFVVCQRKADYDAFGVGGALSDTCTRVSPLRAGARLNIGPGADQIIVQVTARRPGRVSIAGYEISYQQGWRHSRQHVGLDTIVTTS